MKRYQECNPLQKFWRRRWYLAVPFMAVYNTITKVKIYKDEELDGKIIPTNDYETYKYGMWYRLCIGIAQSKMKYTYTMEEVTQHIKDWKKDKKNEKV